MEINDIIRLMEAVSENGLTSFKIEEGNLKISIKKENISFAENPAGTSAGSVGEMVTGSIAGNPIGGLAGNPAGNSAGIPADTASDGMVLESDKVVASPLVGTFYSSASPESEPFVKVGDTVKKGQTLGIIEAMKLMNEIESEFDGVVEAILAGNEDVVEYGQPLFRIR